MEVCLRYDVYLRHGRLVSKRLSGAFRVAGLTCHSSDECQLAILDNDEAQCTFVYMHDVTRSQQASEIVQNAQA